MDELITRSTAAKLLNLRPRTIYFWQKRGLLTPITHISGRPRYTVESVAEASIKSNEVKTKK